MSPDDDVAQGRHRVLKPGSRNLCLQLSESNDDGIRRYDGSFCGGG
ncbi:MAG: hypothetical protein LBJ75_00650 [Puniceicoccales bacterium]|nr:hypothetical protein [Puniceicoccales bacterium]